MTITDNYNVEVPRGATIHIVCRYKNNAGEICFTVSGATHANADVRTT